MNFFKFSSFIVLLFTAATIKEIYSTELCVPGKITGISCFNSKDIIEQYHPTINEIKEKIFTIYRSTGERLTFTRNLILRNIADAQNITQHKLVITRHQLIEAKKEAKYSPIQIQACIDLQGLELAKILPTPLQQCNANTNLTQLTLVRNKILKLQHILAGIGTHCGFLNPMHNDITALKVCIESKIKNIDLQLIKIELEFESALQDVVNYSTNCILNESSKVFVKMGKVLGAIRNCKNVVFRERMNIQLDTTDFESPLEDQGF